MPTKESKGPLLSKRQHRMLQDMGIDVFFSRQAMNDSQAQAASRSASQSQMSGPAQTKPVTAQASAQQPSPASAARAALVQSELTQPPATTLAATPAASQQHAPERPRAAQDANPASAISGSGAATLATGSTIELSFVATPRLVWVGDGPLSDLELRFLQDLAGALHQAATGTPLQDRVRLSDFRWPIVETSGTPERAVAVFCEKHRMLASGTAVVGSAKGLETLRQWLGDNTSHWVAVDALAQTAARGESKRALWTQLVQYVLAAK
ncbi:MAG: hypothetical protein VW867_00950 [Gammaproteobacteria bacterium]|jgi:hypothetical protein